MSHDSEAILRKAKVGTSLSREAWIRLKKNRLAMLGLIIVVAIHFACFILPAVVHFDAERQHPWIGAQPPGFVHFQCIDLNRFEVGKEPDFISVDEACETVTIVSESSQSKDIRVLLRRGKIHRMIIEEGAVALNELDLSKKGVRAIELLENDVLGEDKSGVVLKLKNKPPEGWLKPNQRVAYIRVFEGKPKALETSIQLKNGKVTSIERDGKALQSITISAVDVRSVHVDGQAKLLKHWLGTDDLGRDVLARMLYGGRISLMVGLIATLVSLSIGVLYGSISGFVGGRLDRWMMSGVDILYAIPFMFLVILLLVNFGRNLIMLFVALGAVQWLTMSRIVRGQVMSLREKDFIHAAKLSGTSTMGIIWNHLIPNATGAIIVYTTLTVPAVILEESFLAFIGLTVQYQGRTLDSWGSLVQQGMESLGDHGERSWVLIVPSVAMALTLYGLNVLGDGLRDALDPQLKGKSKS